jgi:hypothetical protein
MTILDKFLQYSDKQAVTSTAVSTNVVDAGATKNANIGRDLGAGTPLYLMINVSQTFTAAGAGTLTATLQDSADNSSWADIASLGTLSLAQLVAGMKYWVGLPIPTRRYTRVNYTVATGPMTAGIVSAHIIDGANFNFAYPDSL